MNAHTSEERQSRQAKRYLSVEWQVDAAQAVEVTRRQAGNGLSRAERILHLESGVSVVDRRFRSPLADFHPTREVACVDA